MKKLLLLMALLTVWHMTILAQNTPTETFTGDSIRFQYPSDWQINVFNANHIALTTATGQIDIFASALTKDALKLTDLVNNVLQQNGVTAPSKPVELQADGSIQHQDVLTDGTILYLRGFPAEDGGVMFVQTRTNDASILATVDALIATLQPTTLGSRYYQSINSQIAFRQPIGFTVSNPLDGFIVVSNTDTMLPVPTQDIPMLKGTFQFLIYSDLSKLPNYVAQEGDTTQDILFSYLNKEACPTGCEFSTYDPISAFPNVTGTQLSVKFPALDNITYAVETPTRPLVFSAYSAPGEIGNFADVIGLVVTSATRVPFVIPQVADTNTVLDKLSIAHPSDWVIQPLPNTNAYSVISSADVANDPNTLQGNQAIVVIIPDFATFKAMTQYPDDNTPATVPSTLASYFGSVAYISGGQQKNEMELGEINGRAYAGVIISPAQSQYEQQIYIVSDGNGDYIFIIAYVRLGWITAWQPVLRDMLAKTSKTQ